MQSQCKSLSFITFRANVFVFFNFRRQFIGETKKEAKIEIINEKKIESVDF